MGTNESDFIRIQMVQHRSAHAIDLVRSQFIALARPSEGVAIDTDFFARLQHDADLVLGQSHEPELNSFKHVHSIPKPRSMSTKTFFNYPVDTFAVH
jgi:hypothetical protein